MTAEVSFPAPAAALLALPLKPDRETVARVLAAERLTREALPDLLRTIPAFNRLLIEGPPESWDEERVEAVLLAVARTVLAGSWRLPPVRQVELPVCYDAELAPDLEKVALRKGIAPADLARRHSERSYVVLATGFAPGFAYLGDLDAELALPRRASFRPQVPRGAVAVADRRTAVYPTEGPGGWHLVGRVPAAYFRDRAQVIDRFAPGCRVRFRQVTRSAFDAEHE